MNERIQNTETVEPGTLVRAYYGKVVYEVIETQHPAIYLEGRLQDTSTGRSVGWRYLDEYRIVDGGER